MLRVKREPQPAKDLLIDALFIISLSAFAVGHFIVFYYYAGNVFDCTVNSEEIQKPSRNFFTVFLNTFVRLPVCELQPEVLDSADLPKSNAFLVLIVLSSAFSILTAIAALLLLIFICIKPPKVYYIQFIAYALLNLLIINIVTDTTLLVFFGVSLSTLNSFLNNNENVQYMYLIDLARIGALFFTVVTKDLIINYLIRIKFIYDILIYLSANRQQIKEIQLRQKHSIYQRGPISAYQDNMSWMKRDRDESENRDSPPYLQPKNPRLRDETDDDKIEVDMSPRGQQPTVEPPSTQPRDHRKIVQRRKELEENLERDRSVYRNDSSILATEWAHIQRPTDSWSRDQWPPPRPIPEPDYSPMPRRLKSALKSGYN